MHGSYRDGVGDHSFDPEHWAALIVVMQPSTLFSAQAKAASALLVTNTFVTLLGTSCCGAGCVAATRG